MNDTAVVAEGLGKSFGRVIALDGVDLELPAGSVLGLLGPNGAGKTTLVRILATLLRADRGRANVAGLDVARQPRAVRRLIGLSGQYAAVDPFLTGAENLVMIGRLYGLPGRAARRRAAELTDQLDLASAAGRLVRTYSGGMRRRLDVAASLIASPPVLFLDEPTTGLDPAGRIALWQVLGQLTAEGASLLLTTQYIEEAERLAAAIVIIDRGRVIAHGTPGELRAEAGETGWTCRLRRVRIRAGWRPRSPRSARGSRPSMRRRAGWCCLSRTGRRSCPPSLAGSLPPDCRSAGWRCAGRPWRKPFSRSPGSSPVTFTQRPEEAAARPGSLPTLKGARHDRRYRSGRRQPSRKASRLAGGSRRHHRRNLRRLVRVPTLLVFATLQPVLFVVLFTYAFGGAVHVPGTARYIDYLLPGIFVLSIGFGASQTGVAIAEDIGTGMVDRSRSLPISGAAVLAGRVTADALRNFFVVLLMTGIGAAVGFRFHAGPAFAAAAVGLAVVSGVAFSWLNLLLGLAVRDPESAGLAGIFPVVILFFTSSVLVPVATMPGWLQASAKANPITVITGALRALCLGGPTIRPVIEAAVWLCVLLAITIPAAVTRYRHATGS